MRTMIGHAVARLTGDTADLSGHPRYRATTRRETRSAAFAAGVTLIVVLIADALLLGEPEPGALTSNVVGIIVAAMLLALLHGPLRRRPEVVAYAIGMTGVAIALQPMTQMVEVRYLMLAYFSLLSVAMALFIPWSLAWHVSWLAVAFGLLASIVLSPLGHDLDAVFRSDALMGGLAAMIASLTGNLMLGRSRLRAFASEAQLRGVHARSREQQAELSRLNAELAVVSRRDPLTGVGNRLRMDEDVQAIRRDLERSGRSGAIALVDVDHFKRYNDLFGHLAGDAVLRRIGSALGASLRAGDGVYRYGGEEFLLLLPGASVADAEAVVARLTESIEELQIAHPGNDPWGVVTISAGVAPMGPGDADNWLRTADSALYRAKDAGRNATGLAERGVIRIMRRPAAGSAPA